FGLIRALTGSLSDAEDILQNTNAVLCEKADQYEPGSNFRAWAFRIARYQVLQHRAKSQRRGEAVPFSQDLIETLAERSEEKESAYERRQRFLKLCLEKLPERQRDAVESKYFRGESVQSIAERNGVKPNAISQLLFRSRVSLLKCIESQLGESSIRPL
ncbi:MAG: sigma-70 family RNA polymerase sigma factor, partial [Verrucomicrobiota bacterium]